MAHRGRRVAHLRRARRQGAHRDRALDARCAACAASRDGVEIRDDADDVRTFDRVVVATHADQALALLAEPTAAEHDVLGAFGYSANETVLHTDGSRAPARTRARGRRGTTCSTGAAATPPAVQVSYDMNRLQRLDEPATTSSR